MGAASSVVAFFRSMGGSIGVSALGAVLSHQVTQKVTAGLTAMGVDTSHQSGSIPTLGALPGPVRALYESAFGEATGHLFLYRCAVRVPRAPLCALHQGSAVAHDIATRNCPRMAMWRPVA